MSRPLADPRPPVIHPHGADWFLCACGATIRYTWTPRGFNLAICPGCAQRHVRDHEPRAKTTGRSGR